MPTTRALLIAATLLAPLALSCARSGGSGVGESFSQIQTLYWPNGNQRARGQLIEGRQEGRWTFWHLYGKKKEEGSFRHGAREGEWMSWYPSGQLRLMVRYWAGQPHGHFVSYRIDGSLREEGDFVVGQRQGRWVEWFPEEKGGIETRYENGIEVSRRDLPAISGRP